MGGPGGALPLTVFCAETEAADIEALGPWLDWAYAATAA